MEEEIKKLKGMVDSLVTEVGALREAVTSLSEALAEKVDKDQVVNQINLSEEGSIQSTQILSLDASKIKAESLSSISSRLGNVEITPQADDGEERNDIVVTDECLVIKNGTFRTITATQFGES